ncbi:MAG: DUF1367 family protein [PVC group bacterium]|nr:DUF1367 family protein [PVC group bacterium]
MARFYVKKVFGKFEAADEESYNIMKKYKHGQTYTAEIWKPRDQIKHRKFFVLINQVVFPNQEKYDSKEALRREITLRCGYYNIHTTIKGKEIYMVKSIAFNKMDDIEFEELYSKAIDVIINHFLPASTEEELKDEVQRILDFV